MMLGLVNVVRGCCCHAPGRRGWGIIGALLAAVLVATVATTAVSAVGAAADPLEAANRAVGSALGVVVTVALAAVVATVAGVIVWAVVDRGRSVRAERTWRRHNAQLDAAARDRVQRAELNRRRQAAGLPVDSPRQAIRVDSSRVAELPEGVQR